MKLTRLRLKQVIREELEKAVFEMDRAGAESEADEDDYIPPVRSAPPKPKPKLKRKPKPDRESSPSPPLLVAEDGGGEYEEAFELELKRVRRDGLRGGEAYKQAKKNLQSLGIHPPKNKPALGKDTESLKEGSIRHDPWTSEDTKELTQLLSRLLTDHGDAPPAFVRQQLKPGIAAIRKLIYSQDFIDWHNSGEEETAELEIDVDPRFSRLELDEGLVNTPQFSEADKGRLPDLEALDQQLEQVINNMDRARVAKDYSELGRLLAQMNELGSEIAKLQDLMAPR